MFQAGEHRDGGVTKKNASKYTPLQTVAQLANMKDEKGRRKYSYQRGNQNGPLPTEAYVRSWFSRHQSNRYKQEGGNKDKYDSMTFEWGSRNSVLTLYFLERRRLLGKNLLLR